MFTSKYYKMSIHGNHSLLTRNIYMFYCNQSVSGIYHFLSSSTTISSKCISSRTTESTLIKLNSKMFFMRSFLARRTESRGSYCRIPGVRCRRCQRQRQCNRQRRRFPITSHFSNNLTMLGLCPPRRYLPLYCSDLTFC